MKATTVRFSDDLWATISTEAALAGVSASQFIREAALARAAAAAGARGEVPFGSLATSTEDSELASMARPAQAEARATRMTSSRALAASTREEAAALRAQSRQARRRSERQQAQARATRSD